MSNINLDKLSPTQITNLVGKMDASQLQSYINKIQEIRDISVSNMTTKEMAEFDSLQVQAYADALSDVKSEQAALLLSTQGLSTAQIAETLAIKEGNVELAYQAMAEAGLLKSKQALSNVGIQEAIATATGNKERAKEVMQRMGLAVAIEGEEAQTVQLTTKKLQQAVATGVLTKAEAQQIATTVGVTLAQKAQATTAMPTWIVNMKAMTSATWLQVKATIAWLATNPVGWCVLAVGAIASITGALIYNSKAAERAKEKISELQDEYAEGVSELESLESELTTINDKIDEIQSKGKLSFTDEEELRNLQKQSAELERQVKLQENLNQQKVNDTVSEIWKTSDDLNKDFDFSLTNYADYKEEVEATRQAGLKALEEGYTTKENIEATMTQMEGFLNDYYGTLLDNIETFETNRQSLLDKHGGDISRLYTDASDKQLFEEISERLNEAYREIYSNAEYNKFVIEPIFSTEKLDGLNEELINYFANDGVLNLTVIEEKFGSALIDALRNACALAGIELNTLLQELYNQAESVSYGFAPMANKVINNAYDAKKYGSQVNQDQSKVRYFEGLDAETQMLIINAEIPDEVKEGTLEDFKEWIDSLQTVADDIVVELDTTNAISSLKDLKDELENVDNALRTFLETGKYEISDLDAIADYFIGLEGIDATILNDVNGALSVLMDTTSSAEQKSSAIDILADSYLNTSTVLDTLNDSNVELIKTQLKLMGYVNAESIVNTKLAKDKAELAYQNDILVQESTNLEKVTYSEIQALLEEQEITEGASKKISELAFEKQFVNSITIDQSDDITDIYKLAEAAGATAEQLRALASAKSILNAVEHDSSIMNTQYYQDALDLLEAVENGTFIENNNEVPSIKVPKADYEKTLEELQKSGSSSAKSTAETFDWIETLISRIQRNITNLGKLVSANYRNWSTRNNALAKEMQLVNQEIGVQQKAYERYMAEANSVPLAENYKALVRSGAFDISSIADETIRDNVELYQQWFEKALDCSDAIEDLRANLAELAKTKFDNVAKQYDDQISLIEHHVSMLEGFVDQSETAGYMASEVYYKAMASKQEENIAQLQDKYSSLLTAFDEAVKNGSIEKYSESWYDMLGDINDVEQSLQDATTQLIEFNQTLQQLSWDVFDRIQDSVSGIAEEANFLIDILDSKELHSDKGVITDEGLAVQGLHAVNYNTYMEQAIAYAEEMARIEEEMANDPYDLELVDRRNELIELQQEAISNAMSEKEAIHSLISDGYDKMLESLNELIDKRKEALQTEKNLYDYQNSISEKTSNISSIQKQLQAYAGDNSEQAKSIIQKLQVSLADAQKDLQETEYEKYISDQEQMLDTLYSQTEEWVNTRLDNIDGLIAESIDATNKNAETISNTLREVSDAYGVKLSTEMESIWNSTNDVVSVYGDILYGVGNDILTANNNIASAINGGTTNVISTIDNLNVSMKDMIASLNNMATANANSIAALQNAIISGQSSASIPTASISTNTTSGRGSGSNVPSGDGENTTDEKYVLLKENGEIIDGGLTWQQAQGMSNAMSGEQKVVKQNSSGETVYDVFDKKTGKQMASGVSLAQAQGMCNAVGTFYYTKRVKAYASGTTNAQKGFNLVSDGNGDEIILTNDGNAVLAKGMQLFPFEGGETVFDASKTAELLKGNLMPLSAEQLWGNIVKTPNIPMVNSGVGGNVNQNINLSFDLPNVTDANSLITELQGNKRFEKVIQSMTADAMLGKNSLGKFKF